MQRFLEARRLICAVLAITLASPAAASATGKTLRWSDGTDINVLNPLIPGAAANNYLNSLTMAFLTFTGDGPIEADLAKVVPSKANGGISADGKTITFVLRPNLRWSDGKPLTSADVAFSVGVINDPKTNTIDRTGFDLIKAVDSSNPNRVIMHLRRSYGPFVSVIFSDDSLPILPKHLLDDKDVNAADYMQLPVGAGPFRYTRWLRGDRVELEANPYYHGAKPKLDKIVYRIISNDEATRASLRTGEIDFWPAASKDDADSFSDLPAIHSTVSYAARTALLMFNLKSPTVGDVAVREALRAGLNRLSIIQRSYRGGGILDDSLVAKNDPGYQRIAPIAFDPAQAAAKLDAAGWKVGSDGVRSKNGVRLHVTLAGVSGSAAVDQIFELIRADWTKLGIEVETRRFVGSIFFGDDVKTGILSGGKFDVAYFGWGAVRTNDLEVGFSCKTEPPNGQNYSKVCDPELESLFRRYDVTYGVAAQNALSRAIQRRLEALLPFIVVAKRNEYYLGVDKMTGLKIPPFAPFGSMLGVDVAK
jgi:peptide/nickel transport system substrate-binding protein